MDRSAIHDMTLKARELLMNEAMEMLQGVYGLDCSGKFEPVARLPAVQKMPEVGQTRARLEKRLQEEADAGLKGQDAMEKLVKEVAFTHLNRLVAFKMMEARKLVRGTVDRYQASNDFMFYLADRPEEMKLYQAGSLPQDALGEGPRDAAYRRFLLWQCATMAGEIQVLFDPTDLASRLFPRPRALKALVEMLNGPEMEEAWGREETVGWIYQYFGEEDKKRVFDRLYRKKQKIRPEDIPAATQLFTPRWIVKFLVQNTLGRQWLQMHPDSGLAQRLDYLVPLVPLAGDVPPVTPKPVREIEVLDPACGTMHFGLVAFDLLAEMYREEMERAGQPGWPQSPSVSSEEGIPAAIVANNIFGIDIDLRAVQLASLALYLKAKSMNPNAAITESHLACAELRLPDQSRLEEFLQSRKFTLPIYERIIRKLWTAMQEGSGIGAGSLLPLEKAIAQEVERERQAHLTSLQRFEDQAEMPEELSRVQVWGEEFWEVLEDQIAMSFNDFAREQASQGEDESYFVGEANKGMRLLDVMRRQYDCVFTNPPYMTRRNMNQELADFLAANYPEGKGDFYTAFIERGCELLKENGRLGMVAQQSFMFISSYQKLRELLLKEQAIETMAHTGPHAFEDIGGEKVNTTNIILRKELDENGRSNALGIYFRLVKEPDSESKQLRFEQALARLRSRNDDEAVFQYRQADFDSIPGSPWVYWITPGLRRLFVELPKLGEIAQPRVGLQTADNFRFLRYWWEVGTDGIGFACKSHVESLSSGKKWFPYMKGGSFQRWYGNQEYAVNWSYDGSEIRTLDIESGRVASRPQNTDFYFRRGVTWTDLTSGRFSARLSPGGFIFDVSGSSVFPPDIPVILAIMNSKFSQFVLNIINPTVHVQVGDLSRLPIPKESSPRLKELVENAVSLAKKNSTEDETTFDFIAPPWHGSLDDTLTEIWLRDEALGDVEQAIDQEVYRLYGIGDADRRAIQAELAGPTAGGRGAKGELDYVDEEELSRRWIGYAMGVVMGRFQPGINGALGQGRFSRRTAERLRALADNDGVATLDQGHQDDLARKVWEALELALGESGAEEVLSNLDGDGGPEALLRRYLEKDFWKLHLQQYRKRPVYWLIQSPKKNYSVYIFHERATRDTLPLILGNRYLAGKINQTKNRMDEVQKSIQGREGKDRKTLERELDDLEGLLLDLEALDAALRRVLEARNERGETVGWAPHIDDGVILNLAPLRELMPSWKEPEKYWRSLEKGEYDWSFTAMHYWPDRVAEKCRKNKSYAIAHGRLEDSQGER